MHTVSAPRPACVALLMVPSPLGSLSCTGAQPGLEHPPVVEDPDQLPEDQPDPSRMPALNVLEVTRCQSPSSRATTARSAGGEPTFRI